MSSSDGLDQLAMFLEQTKRQAELAIDTLNERIFELQGENRGLQEELEEAGNRALFYQNYAEQLKTENSKKYRMEERDDWKNLVDSLQKDRGSLQNEICELERTIEELEQKNFLMETRLKGNPNTPEEGEEEEEGEKNKEQASSSSSSSHSRSSSLSFPSSQEQQQQQQQQEVSVVSVLSQGEDKEEEEEEEEVGEEENEGEPSSFTTVRHMTKEMDKLRRELGRENEDLRGLLKKREDEVFRLRSELNRYKVRAFVETHPLSSSSSSSLSSSSMSSSLVSLASRTRTKTTKGTGGERRSTTNTKTQPSHQLDGKVASTQTWGQWLFSFLSQPNKREEKKEKKEKKEEETERKDEEEEEEEEHEKGESGEPETEKEAKAEPQPSFQSSNFLILDV